MQLLVLLLENRLECIHDFLLLTEHLHILVGVEHDLCLLPLCHQVGDGDDVVLRHLACVYTGPDPRHHSAALQFVN